MEGGHDGGDQEELEYDAGDGIEQGACQKGLKGKGAVLHGEEYRLGTAPRHTAEDHSGNKGDIDRREILLFEQSVQEADGQSVDAKLLAGNPR